MINIGRQLFDGQPQIRVYHVRQLLTTLQCEVGMKYEPVENGVLESVLAIDGVEAVQLNPYSIAVVKARMFEWDEVEPKVKALLTSIELPIEGVIK